MLICMTRGDMRTVRKTVTLADRQARWIEVRTETEDFTSDSGYIRDLNRREKEESTRLRALESAIREGLESGVSAKTVPQIMEEVEARLQTDDRLQAGP